MIPNHIAPKDSADRDDLEIIDFTKNWPIIQAINTIKEELGKDTHIYAMGFSLGSNYLLRHLGNHPDCDKICKIRAAVSVSGAYELPATGIDLQHNCVGIYDQFMLGRISEHFNEKKFLSQHVMDHY